MKVCFFLGKSVGDRFWWDWYKTVKCRSTSVYKVTDNTMNWLWIACIPVDLHGIQVDYADEKTAAVMSWMK